MDLWQKYYGGKTVSIKRIAKDAEEWLRELFGQYRQDYNRDSLLMFDWEPRFINQFLYMELEQETGVLRLIFPRGLHNENLRENYESTTKSFLTYLHKAKLHDELAVAKLRADYETFSFFLYFENEPVQCVWNGEKFSPTNPECVQMGIKVVDYEDSGFGSYDRYIRYLMEKKRNSICEFISSTVFWNNVVGFSRDTNGSDTYFMENRAVADKDLMLLCLALGFDHKVYDKLLTLRTLQFGGEVVNSILPRIGSQEISFLKNLLMDSHWRFLDAKSQVKTLKEIPRRMLVNANVELLQQGLNPIIHLSDAELGYTMTYRLRYLRKVLNEFYERVDGGGGYKLK